MRASSAAKRIVASSIARAPRAMAGSGAKQFDTRGRISGRAPEYEGKGPVESILGSLVDPSEVQPVRAKVLVLHGWTQNARVLFDRVSAFRRKMRKGGILTVFAQAPHVLELDEDSGPGGAPVERAEPRGWFGYQPRDPTEGRDPFHPQASGCVYVGMRRSLEVVSRLWEFHGGFDAILGFSQGGVLAHHIVREAEAAADPVPPTLPSGCITGSDASIEAGAAAGSSGASAAAAPEQVLGSSVLASAVPGDVTTGPGATDTDAALAMAAGTYGIHAAADELVLPVWPMRPKCAVLCCAFPARCDESAAGPSRTPPSAAQSPGTPTLDASSEAASSASSSSAPIPPP